jgi:putative OPT family oligopeptide transporter
MASTPRFQPYIAPETQMPELTVRAVLLGTLLGTIFGASSLYLVLKVGLTVSASIPVAVISITMFRLWSKLGGRDATILENNIVQTAGSAGESIAFGVGVTMPAIMILGFSLEITRVLLVSVLGGLLGILMMIPLRRALIVQQHGKLKYPEGTACAVVLKAGASAESRAMSSEAAKAEAREAEAAGLGQGTNAKAIFAGFGLGLLYKTAMVALKGWRDTPTKVFGAPYKLGSISSEISPELLGVGYIIGPYVASVMCAGGVLAYLVLIPMIKFFGDALPAPLAPGTVLISAIDDPDDIRKFYVLYIGAGAVAACGIISLFRSLPTIWRGLKEGLKDFRPTGAAVDRLRTDQDLSMRFVLIGSLALVGAIMAFPQLHMKLLGALLIIVFGFLFVTVSSRLTGEIGSSSNPISGMTVATLLLTCLIFLLLDWTGSTYYVTALSVGAIVCIASSNGGTTSQDLKTGYLIGATPRLQQIAILFGAFASAVLLGPILLTLNNSGTVYVSATEVAPGLHAPAGIETEAYRLHGPQGEQDSKEYRLWHKTDESGGPAGAYVLDAGGAAVYFVDPGINGNKKERPDGTAVTKFSAPKATLMSYIIKGILGGTLPWTLVLFGVMIAITLEMSAIPSLAFAVGVYLPLSSSMPIFIGGMIRWLVDRQRARMVGGMTLSEEQLAEEADKSAGVLAASGYIAGGAIAGILIALMAGLWSAKDTLLTEWSKAHNPFFEKGIMIGSTHVSADFLSMIPFVLLCLFLYLVGRDLLLAPKKAAPKD